MKTETTTLYTYIADDGTRFDSLEKCKEYEERMNMVALEDEVFDKTVYRWSGEYSGLGAYLGSLCDSWLLKVDEKTLELADKQGWWDTNLLKPGELCFITEYDGDTNVIGTLDDVVKGLEQDIAMLKELKEKNK